MVLACTCSWRLPILSVVLAIVLPSLGRTPAAAQETHSYSYRGVIFGPYGRPWSHEDRRSVLEWMGGVGMNVYVHAPKDEIYQRAQWRDEYPAALLGDYAEEIVVAHDAGVQWVPNVSPGFPLIPSPALPTGPPSRDICFSCKDDVDLLVEKKLEPFHRLGVRTFMVSFDDVQKISTHPEDAAEYGAGDAAYGRMNAELLNRLREHPSLPDVTILTVPADYSGTSPTAYLDAFGAALHPAVRVMWTGTAVVSREIHASDAEAYRRAVWGPDLTEAPKLLVWDNFPVNDYNGNFFSGLGLPTGFKLNVGPYKGRGSDLVEHIDGILANPMNEAEASKIPLYTVAAYLNDPLAYTADDVSGGCPYDYQTENQTAGCLAEAAWREGIASFGGASAGPLLDFVNQMRSTPFDRTESPVFVDRWGAFRDTFRTPFWQGAWRALQEEIAREGAAPRELHAHFPNTIFLAESRNHLAQLEQNARVGSLAAAALHAQRPGLHIAFAGTQAGHLVVTGSVRPSDPDLVARLLAELVPLEAMIRTTPYSVHGDRLQHDFSRLYVGENRMDDFTDWAHEETALWLPTAGLAARGPLVVTVNDVRAVLSADGSFRAEVAPAQEAVVLVTDAAGYSTGEVRQIP